MDPLSEENLKNDSTIDLAVESQETGDSKVRNRQNIIGRTDKVSENAGHSMVAESNQDLSQTTNGEAKVREEKSGMWSKFKKLFPSTTRQPVNRKDDDNIDGLVRENHPQNSQINPQENEIFLGGIHKKKTLANGLLDFAFLTANVNQLHSNIVSKNGNVSVIVLIAVSIFLQVFVSLLLITTSYILSKSSIINTSNSNNDVESGQQIKQMHWLNLIDHLTIAIILIIAILNIFIAAFSSAGSDTSTQSPSSPS